MDYIRPKGDITTVLDLTDRDPQDNTYFPLDAETWFHRNNTTVTPSALSIQEFTQRGPADWGQKLSFEIGSLPAGDLLQSITLQFKVGSWYNQSIIKQLYNGEITTNMQYSSDYWTYINSLGTAIIEYAEFIVKDQTIERLSGEFIRAFFNIYGDINNLIGISADAIGNTSFSYLSTPNQTQFNPNRPYPTEDGTYFCILPFFFLRTRLKEVFPLLSCNEGDVRIDVKLRPFNQVVRQYIGYRQNCDSMPLNRTVHFTSTETQTVETQTTECPPAFRDFRILTSCALIMGSVREKYLYNPFEQMIKISQTFHFDEPLKYLVSKPQGMVEIQLPLELNHPVTEIFWVFRRKSVVINNEWANFTPAISYQTNPDKKFPPWLDSATIRLNGSELISAKGDWFREHIASVHKAGIIAYNSYMYGYSFATYPDEHQPSGSANMSKIQSIRLNLKVNVPIPVGFNASVDFDPSIESWEVFVFAIHYNWLRFENGICNRMFTN